MGKISAFGEAGPRTQKKKYIEHRGSKEAEKKKSKIFFEES